MVPVHSVIREMSTVRDNVPQSVALVRERLPDDTVIFYVVIDNMERVMPREQTFKSDQDPTLWRWFGKTYEDVITRPL